MQTAANANECVVNERYRVLCHSVSSQTGASKTPGSVPRCS